ncbi:uncharacterized protein LOC134822226 [Bolinopsis microptera]|uniref:uncharacterized protein LOC134822226 n=1 Tax=Bolinopsis microptera TaxID=2820187 RepID=UPI00307AC787
MAGLQVIGAGLGRTGTLSMKLALEELGFNPCHHMAEVMLVHTDRNHLFKKIYQEEDNIDAIKELFGGYVAAVDYPGCMFYEEFMKINPDAKVILTVRDSPEAWAKSARETIFMLNTVQSWLKRKVMIFVQVALNPRVYWIQQMMVKVHGVAPSEPKTDLAQMYTDWNKRVIETVAAEKLLIFNVKEGWKPLCDFLGVPVPDTPFPRVNSTANFKEMMSARVKKKMGVLLLKFVLVVSIGAGAAVLLTHFG